MQLHVLLMHLLFCSQKGLAPVPSPPYFFLNLKINLGSMVVSQFLVQITHDFENIRQNIRQHSSAVCKGTIARILFIHNTHVCTV